MNEALEPRITEKPVYWDLPEEEQQKHIYWCWRESISESERKPFSKSLFFTFCTL